MNQFLINILIHALGSAPQMVEDVTSAFKMNWNVPHVAQARQGIQILSKLIDDVAGQGAQGEVTDPVQLSPQSVSEGAGQAGVPNPSV